MFDDAHCRYAFHKEAAGGKDEPGTQKDRLLQIFGHWTDMVTDLIRATPEDDVIRRDIFDRPPIFKWTEVGALLIACRACCMSACWIAHA
jgi:zeaxanthin epoxidase